MCGVGIARGHLRLAHQYRGLGRFRSLCWNLARLADGGLVVLALSKVGGIAKSKVAVVRLKLKGSLNQLAATLIITAGKGCYTHQCERLRVAVAILEVVKQCFGALGVSHGDAGCCQ